MTEDRARTPTQPPQPLDSIATAMSPLPLAAVGTDGLKSPSPATAAEAAAARIKLPAKVEALGQSSAMWLVLWFLLNIFVTISNKVCPFNKLLFYFILFFKKIVFCNRKIKINKN